MKHRIAIVRLGTKRLPAYTLVEKGRLHITRLTDNPAFPDPKPTLAELAAACDELDAATQRASFNRGRMDIQRRNSAYTQLTRLIRSLGGYVQATCDGSAESIHSTGFDVKKGRQPSQPVDAPREVVAVRTPIAGRITVRWSAVRHRKLYAVYMRSGGQGTDGEWVKLAQTSRNEITVNELTSDAYHSFRVLAIGTLGPGPVSAIATAKAA